MDEPLDCKVLLEMYNQDLRNHREGLVASARQIMDLLVHLEFGVEVVVEAVSKLQAKLDLLDMAVNRVDLHVLEVQDKLRRV